MEGPMGRFYIVCQEVILPAIHPDIFKQAADLSALVVALVLQSI